VKFGLVLILCCGLFQTCFGDQNTVKRFNLGANALEKIVASRESLKKAIENIVKDGGDLEDQKKRLEMIMNEVCVAFPGGDWSLQERVEKAILRIKYLEQEKQYIHANYWQMNKALVVLSVIAGVGLNVGFWLLMRYFLDTNERISRVEDGNRMTTSNLGYTARNVFGANRNQNNKTESEGE